MKKMKWFAFLAMVMIAFSALAPMAHAIEEAPPTKSGSVMVVSINTGATIYEKNADAQIHPASTTKLMTMAVAIDLIKDLKETYIFDKNACYADLEIGSSNMGLKDGEKVTMEQLLYGTAVSSANEGTNALAIHLCGSIEKFVAKMNEYAEKWGMENTHFANTHGLTKEGHYTTARDMAILAKKVFSDDRLLPYLSASYYELPASDVNTARSLITTNQLMRQNSGNYYKYCFAGKTGSTEAAGFNLISASRYKGIEYICITMNAPYGPYADNPVFEESVSLYRWAYQNFGVQTLLEETTSVAEIKVALCAKSDYVMLVPKGRIEAVVANNEDIEAFERVVKTEEVAYAPIKKGDVLGTVSLVKNGVEYGSVELVASEDMERSAILYYLHLIRSFFSNPIVLIVVGVLVVAIIVYIIFMIRQNRNRRRRRLARRIRF